MGSDAERAQRIAENESVFRDVNERIQEGHVAFELEGAQEFLCECGDAGCTERIRLTRSDYERVRANPKRFAIVPGHDEPALEEVLEDHGTYAVVEKVGFGGAIAEARDPRSRDV